MQKKMVRISSTLIILSLLLITTISNNSINVMAWETTATPVCIAGGDQQEPRIISTTDGGLIAVWSDDRNIDTDIYAQKFDSRGNSQWALNGVPVCTAINSQFKCVPFADVSGGAYFIWWDLRSGTNYDIYAQRLNSSGNPQWTLNGIPVCNFSENQQNFDVCTDGLPQHFGPGGIIVTWEDVRAGSSSRDIYAQRIALNGTTLWSDNGVVVCDATDKQSNPKIVPDYTGGAFISWEDCRSGGTQDDIDIYIQRINSTGVAIWGSNGLPVCAATGEQSGHRMINSYPEGAIIAWADKRNGEYDLYAQSIDKYGTIYWGGNGMAVCTANGSQSWFMMCTDGNYGAILAWADDRNNIGAGENDIYSQHINSSGNLLWAPNGTVVCNAIDRQMPNSMISDGDNGAILTWQDKRDTLVHSVYAQRIQSDGSGMWGVNGIAVDPYPNEEQSGVDLALVQTGEAVIIWEDNRDSGMLNIWSKYMIDNTIPSSSTPPHDSHQQGSTATITWSLYDNSGGGYYKVRKSIPDSIHSVDVIPWTEWDHGDTIVVPINTTEIGQWFYRIEYNDSNGNFGISHSVLVNVTARPPPNDPDFGPIIIIAAVSGCVIVGVVVFIVIKKRKPK